MTLNETSIVHRTAKRCTK